MTIRSFVVGKLGVESKVTALAALAMSSLVLTGCTVSDPVGAKSSGVSSSADIDTHTRIELSNRESVPRPSEVVELDLSVVRARYQAFDSSDFSVHLLGMGDSIITMNILYTMVPMES